MSSYPGFLTTWTVPGVIEKLTELHKQGVSHTQIARILNQTFKINVSKNAVTGKVHRLGLYQQRLASDPALASRKACIERAMPTHDRRVSGKAALEKAQTRSKAALVAEPKVEKPRGPGGFLATPFSATEPLEDVADTSAPLPGTIPRRWTERVHGMCSWPVGLASGAEQLNCCQPVKGGRGLFAASWCPTHHAIGVRQPKTSAASTWTAQQRREHGERIRAGLARRRAA